MVGKFNLGFQSSVTPIMEGIVDLHNHIFFFLVLVFFFVFWIFGTILYHFWWKVYHPKNSQDLRDRFSLAGFRHLSHSTSLEVIWTILPSFILVAIAVPSFALLYAMDEIMEPTLTLKVVGHQWYWNYQYSNCLSHLSYVPLDNPDLIPQSLWSSLWSHAQQLHGELLQPLPSPAGSDLPPSISSDALVESIRSFSPEQRARLGQLFSDLPPSISSDALVESIRSFSPEQRARLGQLFSDLPPSISSDALVESIRSFSPEQSLGQLFSDLPPLFPPVEESPPLQETSSFASWERSLILSKVRETLGQPFDFGPRAHLLPTVQFDSYMLSEDELLSRGDYRLLEVDEPVVLPVNSHIRLLITAEDVIHSFAVPQLGLKVDAVPGRLNQQGIFIKRRGVFYGQCSELCGVNHGFMPIVIKAVSMKEFVHWYLSKFAALYPEEGLAPLSREEVRAVLEDGHLPYGLPSSSDPLSSDQERSFETLYANRLSSLRDDWRSPPRS